MQDKQRNLANKPKFINIQKFNMKNNSRVSSGSIETKTIKKESVSKIDLDSVKESFRPKGVSTFDRNGEN